MPRRILLFITDLEIGGTPTVVRELARRLDAPPEVEIEVVCLKGWGPVADQIQEAGIHVTAIGATSRFHIGRAVKKLAAIIHERQIDTVFSFLVHANAVAARTAKTVSGVRWIQSIQTTQPKPRWHWWVQRRVQEAAEKIVVPSPSAAEIARVRASVPAERIVVIPNAIDVMNFSRLAAERATTVERRRGAEPGTRIGFLGRLDPVKRVEDLIRAAARLGASSVRPYELHVFGDGTLRGVLERQAAKELRPAHVHYEFHGAVDTPGEALKQIDLLVLPSVAEGFGLVLIEAMATGVPVIATDVPGIRDVVAHERTGLLVKPKSPKALAEAIGRLCDETELRRRMVINGFEEVRKRYSWETVLPMYGDLLQINGD